MRRSRIFILVSAATTLIVAACGLQDGGVVVLDDTHDAATTTADGAPIDGATVDGAVPKDGSPPSNDGAPTDGSTIDSSVPDAGKPYFCGTTAVANCATDCPASPILCGAVNLCVSNCGLCGSGVFQCDACFPDGGRSVSVCEPQDASAFAACLIGQTRCPCADQNDCPGANQTCDPAHGCFECGELDASNNMSTCKSGSGNKCKLDPVHYGECF